MLFHMEFELLLSSYPGYNREWHSQGRLNHYRSIRNDLQSKEQDSQKSAAYARQTLPVILRGR